MGTFKRAPCWDALSLRPSSLSQSGHLTLGPSDDRVTLAHPGADGLGMSPVEFEVHAGRGATKKWRHSIWVAIPQPDGHGPPDESTIEKCEELNGGKHFTPVGLTSPNAAGLRALPPPLSHRHPDQLVQVSARDGWTGMIPVCGIIFGDETSIVYVDRSKMRYPSSWGCFASMASWSRMSEERKDQERCCVADCVSCGRL